MTDPLIPDAWEREECLRVDDSFIIQAPAGSGKTALLIQRFLALLATVNQPEEVVAITFTRKAAAEMRHRILKALEASQRPAPLDQHALKTWHLAQAVLVRSEQLNWHLETHPNRLRITTIDAFSLYLVSQMPVLSRMGIQPGIVEDPQPLYERAVKHLFTHLSQQKTGVAESLKVVLAYFHYDLDYIERLLVHMLSHREQWIKYALLGQVEAFPSFLASSLQALIEDSLKPAYDLFASLNDNTQLNAIFSFAAQQSDPPIPDFFEWPAPHADNLGRWQWIAQCCLTNQGEWRKTVNKNQGFPPSAHFKTQDEKRMAIEAKASFIEFLQIQENNPDKTLGLCLGEIAELPPIHYYDTQWELLKALLTVLTMLLAELRLIFQQSGKTDFIEIATATQLALGPSDSPSDLRLLLDNQIRHLLVDEFQDTSSLQFELIEQLTAGWAPGDGRTLFLVGDPMQSIYRFRQAEVGLFLKAAQEGIGDLSLKFLQLKANFRSDPKLIEWINQALAPLFPKSDNIPLGAITYAPAQALRSPLCHADLKFFLNDNETAYAKDLITTLQALLNESETSQIALLVRSRSQAKKVIPWLKAFNLPYQAVDIDHLAADPLIELLLALTKAYLRLFDTCAWLSILRAPWCGLTLDELLHLSECSQQAELSLWEILKNSDHYGHFSIPTQQRIARLVSLIEKAFSQRQRLTLREIIEQLWLALAGPHLLPNGSGLSEAQRYFDRLEKQSEGPDPFDVDSFEMNLTKVYSQPPMKGSPRIHILTIHKSKGLEFDTVCLLGLEQSTRSDDKAMMVWMEQPRANQAFHDMVLAISPQGEDCPLYNFIRRQEKKKAQYETIRLLYVATTRAKTKLFLFAQVKPESTPNPHSFLGYLNPILTMNHSDAFQSLEEISPKTETLDKIHYRLPATWTYPLKQHPPRFDNQALSPENLTWRLPEEKFSGLVIHEFFRLLAETQTASWGNWSENQRKDWLYGWMGLMEIPEIFSSSLMNQLEKIHNLLYTSSDGRWLISQLQNSSAKAEWSLSRLRQKKIESYRLDLSFMDKEGRQWILDYKTTEHLGEQLVHQLSDYRLQLENYARLLLEIKGMGPIYLGLYFPFSGKLESWTYPSIETKKDK